MIIEDSLAKNWLQGQLKTHQLIYDHSFNTEIIKVSVVGLFQVLESVFNAEADKFKSGYAAAKSKKTSAERIAAFKGVAIKFAELAKAAGAGVVAVLKAHIFK